MDGIVWAGIKIGGGLVVLIAGGELLVRGASALAAALRISPLVIGLTVVAFGTSAPELAVSLQAALAGSPDLAVGNVVGSNICNILLILGISAMIVPLVVSSQLVRSDVPIMIVSSLLVLVFGWDGRISRGHGLVLFAGIMGYVWWCLRQSRRESREVQVEFAQQWSVDAPSSRTVWWQIASMLVGLMLLGIGSRLLIDGAVLIATRLGISQLVIGLTIVAIGTSLPEVVTSVVAAIRGERDIAVGNIVGSNIFNILCVLGLTSAIAPAGVAISPEALAFDIPVMIVVAIACLPIFSSGHVIARWEGGLFVFYYVAYTIYLVLHATGSDLRQAFSDVMTYFVIPLSIITLITTVWRGFRQPHTTNAAGEAGRNQD